MKQLFNYGLAKILVRVNGEVKTFLPNSAITVDEEQAKFLLKLKNIKEIVLKDNTIKEIKEEKKVIKKESKKD